MTSAHVGLQGITTGDEAQTCWPWLEPLWWTLRLFDCTGACCLNAELVLIFLQGRDNQEGQWPAWCVGGCTPWVSQLWVFVTWHSRSWLCHLDHLVEKKQRELFCSPELSNNAYVIARKLKFCLHCLTFGYVVNWQNNFMSQSVNQILPGLLPKAYHLHQQMKFSLLEMDLLTCELSSCYDFLCSTLWTSHPCWLKFILRLGLVVWQMNFNSRSTLSF